MDNRHLWVRSSRQWAILRIRATIINAMRNWLDDHDYLLVDTPIITPAAGEETTTLFEIDYFGEPAFLAQTGQLYNEANMAAFGKVYCFGPTFRAEKSKTRRHLMEFWMLEPEMAFLLAGRPDGSWKNNSSAMSSSACWKNTPRNWRLSNATPASWKVSSPPLPGLPMTRPVERLQEAGR